MGRLFESPWPIIVIVVVALLLFGAPKLPGIARSLGQSMRIFKSEVKQMRHEPDRPAASHQAESADVSEPAAEGSPAPAPAQAARPEPTR
ncbi:Sec-independent protein translocase subunit TatA [Paenarthrobacter sp. DKR-5]|uniref:Sec-independent protein translocase subunit TatA n=1 Tax=Paenarthrobacter sp. DKR-5 TaxID=2835535 RepID=UPI001BDBC060|nr:Sec-independent protein translocase subunit TatA [Paenarthrobacter sp. DKR-5]MBT1002001.1 Sec-independent protein translocase subunit TatA [Paenarthrobacter sp. DKR-5]